MSFASMQQSAANSNPRNDAEPLSFHHVKPLAKRYRTRQGQENRQNVHLQGLQQARSSQPLLFGGDSGPPAPSQNSAGAHPQHPHHDDEVWVIEDDSDSEPPSKKLARQQTQTQPQLVRTDLPKRGNESPNSASIIILDDEEDQAEFQDRWQGNRQKDGSKPLDNATASNKEIDVIDLDDNDALSRLQPIRRPPKVRRHALQPMRPLSLNPSLHTHTNPGLTPAHTSVANRVGSGTYSCTVLQRNIPTLRGSIVAPGRNALSGSHQTTQEATRQRTFTSIPRNQQTILLGNSTRVSAAAPSSTYHPTAYSSSYPNQTTNSPQSYPQQQGGSLSHIQSIMQRQPTNTWVNWNPPLHFTPSAVGGAVRPEHKARPIAPAPMPQNSNLALPPTNMTTAHLGLVQQAGMSSMGQASLVPQSSGNSNYGIKVPSHPSLPTATTGVQGDGLYDEGLKALAKHNNLTADATEEVETPPELTTELMPHQRRALAWMAKRESPIDTDEEVLVTDDQCLGGILADEQGLGKTLSMIALLLKNKPKPVRSDQTRKKIFEHIPQTCGARAFRRDNQKNNSWRTLIVCPMSLIGQWKKEIETRVKTEHLPSIHVYHGPKRERNPLKLERYDVVITTYSILVPEYPKVLKDHPEYELRKQEKLPLPKRRRGPLYNVSWNRVILDEAQYVKNRGTESWSAVYSLKAEKRWCLTGTPIQNSVDDIYSLFCFLRYNFVPNYRAWKERWKNLLEHPNAAVRQRTFQKLQTVAGVVLLRRTKQDKINGQLLLNLPVRNVDVKKLQFRDKDESDFYNAVVERSVVTVNRFVVSGTLALNYSHVLLMLLRLRQACSHPFLIEYARMSVRNNVSQFSMVSSYETSFDFEELEETIQIMEGGDSLLDLLEDPVRDTIIVNLSPPLKSEKKPQPNYFHCSHCTRVVDWKEGSFLSCGHCFCPQCRSMIFRHRKCLQCHLLTKDPNLYEVFMNAQELRREVHARVIMGNRHDTSNLTVKQFKKWMYRQLEDNGYDILNKNDSLRPHDAPAASNIGSSDRKGEQQSLEETRRKCMKAMSQPSTKITEILKILSEISQRAKNEKTLIYSQWTSMLDIVELHLRREGYQPCRLDGTMTATDRQAQIEEFNTSESKKIFLISLHAGGTGLNLTAASNVILCDVWWNPAVEEQAIDRVHRIGQIRDVHVTKFHVVQSVEDKIYTLCAQKRAAADGVLGTPGAQTWGRRKLSLGEIMTMFRSVAQDVVRNAQQGTEAASAAANILNCTDNARTGLY